MNFDRRTTPYKGDKAIIICALDPRLIGQEVLALSDPQPMDALNFDTGRLCRGIVNEVTIPDVAKVSMASWGDLYGVSRFVYPTAGLLRIPPADELTYLYGVKEKPVEA